MGDYVEAPNLIPAGEEGLRKEIVGDIPQTCVCDTKTLLAYIADEGKTYQHVIDEMQAAINDDKRLKSQLLANEVI